MPRHSPRPQTTHREGLQPSLHHVETPTHSSGCDFKCASLIRLKQNALLEDTQILASSTPPPCFAPPAASVENLQLATTNYTCSLDHNAKYSNRAVNSPQLRPTKCHAHWRLASAPRRAARHTSWVGILNTPAHNTRSRRCVWRLCWRQYLASSENTKWGNTTMAGRREQGAENTPVVVI